MSDFNDETRAIHFRIDNAATRPIATPIYQNSAFSADSDYFYTRKSNPNSTELEGALALLEQCQHVVSTTTGMSAIHLVLGLLQPGDHLVINRLIYGCSYKLFQRYTAQYHIKLTVLDFSAADWSATMPDDATLVFFETPTNPFLQTLSIQHIAARAKRGNPAAIVVVDNTWATPLFQKPLQHGADISLASATKYISGHSDVMGGFIATDNLQLADRLRTQRFYQGCILDPHSAWLLRRSLHTLPIRMREHVRITRLLCEFLQRCPQIKKLYFPGMDPAQLQNYGGIVFVELVDALADKYMELTAALRLFDTGTGMACVSSMIARPWFGSHASLMDHEKQAMGISPNLIRLCFGLENEVDLIADLSQALRKISTVVATENPHAVEA